ncbi:MAG: hypothetical protein PSN34_11120 [Urechidicola sp.]|nr:hypothetical protein [Urechidicola sp.]
MKYINYQVRKNIKISIYFLAVIGSIWVSFNDGFADSVLKYKKEIINVIVVLLLSGLFWVFVDKLIDFINSKTVGHVKAFKSCTKKLMDKELESGNKYLFACFDGLLDTIINSASVEGDNITINGSLNSSIDGIKNGTNLDKNTYKIFLKNTANLKPREIIGVWDVTTFPIDNWDEIYKNNMPVFSCYKEMYKALKENNEIVRIYIVKDTKSCSLASIQKNSELVCSMKWFESITNVSIKFVFIDTNIAKQSAIHEGIIVDSLYYLSYRDKKVFFETKRKDFIVDVKAILNNGESYRITSGEVGTWDS